MIGEKVPHDDNDDILVFELDKVRVELGSNRNPNVVDLIDSKLAAMDKLYPAVDDTAPTNFNAETIGVEGFLQAELNGAFRAEIRSKLHQGGVVFRDKR